MKLKTFSSLSTAIDNGGGGLVTKLYQTLWDPMECNQQAPLSMGFSRQQYWSGLPFPSAGDLPDPGIEPRSPAWEADDLISEPPGKPQIVMENNVCLIINVCQNIFAEYTVVAMHGLQPTRLPLSMGFSRQEYWSGLPFPSPGDLPDPGIKPGSPTFQADALTSEPQK